LNLNLTAKTVIRFYYKTDQILAYQDTFDNIPRQSFDNIPRQSFDSIPCTLEGVHIHWNHQGIPLVPLLIKLIGCYCRLFVSQARKCCYCWNSNGGLINRGGLFAVLSFDN